MIRSLVPWAQLTRTGVPDFRVCRLPLESFGEVMAPGQLITSDTVVHRTRLRQLYEMRRIEPVIAPKGSKQMLKESGSAKPNVLSSVVRSVASLVAPSVAPPVQERGKGGAAPTALPFTSPVVPVTEEAETEAQAGTKPVPSSGDYRPVRRSR